MANEIKGVMMCSIHNILSPLSDKSIYSDQSMNEGAANGHVLCHF